MHWFIIRTLGDPNSPVLGVYGSALRELATKRTSELLDDGLPVELVLVECAERPRVGAKLGGG